MLSQLRWLACLVRNLNVVWKAISASYSLAVPLEELPFKHFQSFLGSFSMMALTLLRECF